MGEEPDLQKTASHGSPTRCTQIAGKDANNNLVNAARPSTGKTRGRLIKAIVAFLVFAPTGAVAIYYYVGFSDALIAHDDDEALRLSHRVTTWLWISVVCSLVVVTPMALMFGAAMLSPVAAPFIYTF